MDAVVRARSKRSLAFTIALLSASWFALVMAAPNAVALDRYVSGPISVDTTWVSTDTYYVTGHVTVLPGVTLTIEPGTRIYFDVGRGLFVEGALLAEGSEGDEIQFLRNSSFLLTPWYGIQFNASSDGSVAYSFFDRADRAVAIIDSSPAIHHNGVLGATWGFALLRSNTVLSDNVVDRAAIGVYVAESDAQIMRNVINGTTTFGIQAQTSGSPSIIGNSITNGRGVFTVGIYTTGVDPYIDGNSVQGAQGRDGSDGTGVGAPGADGGTAVGVLVDGGTGATVTNNWVDSLRGGRGGNGAPNPGATGGRGGNGGSVSGVVVANVDTADVELNIVANLIAGRGGMGGQGSGTSTGGDGGNGGDTTGVQVINVATVAWIYSNIANTIAGGVGGHGGNGDLFDGSGAAGGDSLGLFVLNAVDADISGNTLAAIQGGLGGNSTLLGVGNRPAGAGGAGTAVALFGPAGSSTVHGNGVVGVSGGIGGRGSPGGRGGDGTAVLVFGNNDGLFNSTSTTWNTIVLVAGGNGGNGVGPARGGDGGTAAGIGAIRVTATVASNGVDGLFGGSGGDGVIGGRGGDASGIAGVILQGSSVLDSVSNVLPGSSGNPPPVEDAWAVGFYTEGNAAYTTAFTVGNATLGTIGDYDFFAGDYADLTTINLEVLDGRVRVEPAGNLTVRNFLAVEVLWPNQVTPVAGAHILVMDNSDTVWDGIAPSGLQSWILVTDRIYVNSNPAFENTTTLDVTYAPYNFVGDPRVVAMGESVTESVFMDDQSAPTSAAVALPTYRKTLTFAVRYTANDGNGTGLGDITLWYRTREGGGWIPYDTQPADLEGEFTFIAPTEGLYEFATTVNDTSDNTQPGPSQNHTWTIVDTTRPTSRVMALPEYQTALSFTVTWAPEAGVTDIEKYKIQVNDGADWEDWITTTSTSATFPATAPGVYAFRSIATDHAGNTESASAGNDTWTIVDPTRPYVTNSSPLGANTSRSPVIQVTFSEPMDRDSVEEAFSIAGVDGNFTWSADSRILTFLPNAVLAGGTTFIVVISTEARDVAGNHMQDPLTFQFTTVPAPASAALSIGDLWWLFLIVGAALGGGLLVVMRRRAAATAKPPPVPAATKAASTAIVEDLFLLNHRDGLLIKHETRRLRPDVDTDILTGMLTAVQAFVKDALKGDDYAELNEMTVGQMHILIARGKWLALAARIEGAGSQPWTGQIERCIKDMEDHHWDQLEDWAGDMALARVLTPYLKKLLQGGYTLVEA
jgi:hypothetical protein